MNRLIPIALTVATGLGALIWWFNTPTTGADSKDNSATPVQADAPGSSQVAVDKDKTSRKMPPHTEAPVQARQVAPGRVPGRQWPEFSEKELLAMSLEQQALVIHHIDPAIYSDLASYALELEDRINSGKGGELDLADLYYQCSLYNNSNRPSTDADSENVLLRARYQMRSMCKTLPDRGMDYDTTLITDCAKRGDRDCILKERSPNSIAVGINPRSPEAIAWGQEMMSRLQALVDAGDREAMTHAARYMADGMDPYGLLNYQQAAEYMDYVVSSATSDMDLPLRQAQMWLIHTCGGIAREKWSEKCQ